MNTNASVTLLATVQKWRPDRVERCWRRSKHLVKVEGRPRDYLLAWSYVLEMCGVPSRQLSVGEVVRCSGIRGKLVSYTRETGRIDTGVRLVDVPLCVLVRHSRPPKLPRVPEPILTLPNPPNKDCRTLLLDGDDDTALVDPLK